MRRTARIAAASMLAAGLMTATLAGAPATAAAAGPAAGGWQLEAIYPTKGECLTAGQEGVGQRWDEFECAPGIDPLSAPSQTSSWFLWTITWVG